VGDPLTDTFCDSIYARPPLEQIQQSQELATNFGRAHWLAMLTVQLNFWGAQEFCKETFVEFGLMKPCSQGADN
jgi:hypothetical protein